MKPLNREEAPSAERESEERRTEGSFGTGRLKHRFGRKMQGRCRRIWCGQTDVSYGYGASRFPRFIPVIG